MTRDRDNKARSHTHTHTHLPPLYQKEDENRKMCKLKDVKIGAAEISLIISDPVRIKFSSVDIVEDASIVGCMK